jgi:hypothetical protein
MRYNQKIYEKLINYLNEYKLNKTQYCFMECYIVYLLEVRKKAC